jgi:hypothetical protein
MAEHWTLVASKEVDRDKFVAGDFVSVPFEEACSRFAKIVKSGIDDSARKKFDAVRKHRNQMVHFFHEADGNKKTLVEEVAIEQLGAWYELQQLLTVHWADHFEPWKKDIADIERRFKRQRDYLAAKFNALKSELARLKEQGEAIELCSSCHFTAAKIVPEIGDLRKETCLVCGHRSTWINLAVQNANQHHA